MSSLAVKRISADIKNIKRNKLEDHNIHVFVDDEDIFKMKALIIGPEDTPYENGFYFFFFGNTQRLSTESTKGKVY